MAHAGWKATGLLRPLWNEYEGGRDGLAEAVGTQGTVLSSINTGERNLGHDLAGRLAAELGISLAELGAPQGEMTDQESRTLLRRLQALEERVDEIAERTAGALSRLEAEIARLSQRIPPAGAQSQGPAQ